MRPINAATKAKIDEAKSANNTPDQPKKAPIIPIRCTSPKPIASRGITTDVAVPESDRSFSIECFAPLGSSISVSRITNLPPPCGSPSTRISPVSMINRSLLRENKSHHGIDSPSITKLSGSLSPAGSLSSHAVGD